MLISGLYHPQKHNYEECNLLSPLMNFLGNCNTLGKDLNTVLYAVATLMNSI